MFVLAFLCSCFASFSCYFSLVVYDCSWHLFDFAVVFLVLGPMSRGKTMLLFFLFNKVLGVPMLLLVGGDI